MKKLLMFFSTLTLAAIMAVNFTSCDNEDPVPVPTVKLLADIDPTDQYSVILAVQQTDAATYSWSYGDGESSTTMGGHTYMYAASGDYTISVTVTNESGSATATANVTINPSVEEMISGVDAAGKTWVMSTTPAANDGAGPLHPSNFDVITLPFALVPNGDALGYVGFPDEYDNEFTFKPDGSYEVDNGNGQNLCTQIFAFVNTGGAAPGDGWTKGSLGFATMPWSIEDNATWSVDEDATIAMEVMSDDPNTASEYTPMAVSYEGVTQVSITGGYFGILDMSNYVIIENITPDKMQVVILMHTEMPDKLSIFSRITLIPKQ
jgi:PKD repeat protein